MMRMLTAGYVLVIRSQRQLRSEFQVNPAFSNHSGMALPGADFAVWTLKTLSPIILYFPIEGAISNAIDAPAINAPFDPRYFLADNIDSSIISRPSLNTSS